MTRPSGELVPIYFSNLDQLTWVNMRQSWLIWHADTLHTNCAWEFLTARLFVSQPNIWFLSLWYFWKYLWTWLDIKSSKLSEYAAELADMTCWHMMDTVIDFSSQVLRLFELTCLLHFSPFFLDYLELFLLWPGPEPGFHSIHFFSAHLLRSDIRRCDKVRMILKFIWLYSNFSI